MLVAECEGWRVCADNANREDNYICPGCKGKVVLRKGDVRIAHFAHLQKTNCDWGGNQSEEHLKTKKAFYKFFRERQSAYSWVYCEGVEMEYPIAGTDRVADVYARIRDKQQAIVVEIQKTPISRSEIVARTMSYFSKDIAVLWVIPATVADLQKKCKDGLFSMYSPSDYERWIHGYNRGRIYFYDYERDLILEARFLPVERYVEETQWGGGYWTFYKRYKNLRIIKEYSLDQAVFCLRWMKSFETDSFFWPEGIRLIPLERREEWDDDFFSFCKDERIA